MGSVLGSEVPPSSPLETLPPELITTEISPHLDLVSRCALSMASTGLRATLGPLKATRSQALRHGAREHVVRIAGEAPSNRDIWDMGANRELTHLKDLLDICWITRFKDEEAILHLFAALVVESRDALVLEWWDDGHMLLWRAIIRNLKTQTELTGLLFRACYNRADAVMTLFDNPPPHLQRIVDLAGKKEWVWHWINCIRNKAEAMRSHAISLKRPGFGTLVQRALILKPSGIRLTKNVWALALAYVWRLLPRPPLLEDVLNAVSGVEPLKQFLLFVGLWAYRSEEVLSNLRNVKYNLKGKAPPETTVQRFRLCLASVALSSREEEEEELVTLAGPQWTGLLGSPSLHVTQ